MICGAVYFTKIGFLIETHSPWSDQIKSYKCWPERLPISWILQVTKKTIEHWVNYWKWIWLFLEFSWHSVLPLRSAIVSKIESLCPSEIIFDKLSILPVDCPEHERSVDCYNPCSARLCPNTTKSDSNICPVMCEMGRCDCEDGYKRNECGVCLLDDHCIRPCECKSRDKEEIRCVNDCSVRSCHNVIHGKKEKCSIEPCTKRCDCKFGYARNRNGECVPESLCEEDEYDSKHVYK